MRYSLTILLVFLLSVANAQPKPTPQQRAWHEMEFYLFMHFGPNTFTGLEWGHGTEKEEVFNPTSLDCEQWCRVAKASGAKGIIITAKHHDGFCLWPSKFSTHTVRESKWRDGKGDVLKELSEACKKYELKFGVYISPWDRNHPDYGTEKYNDVFVSMMKEIFTNYGPIWELWWDGANGEGPNGKVQLYDWHRFEQTVRELSPNTVVFSDIGPDVRWCGNESGIAGKTNWNTLDTAGFTRGAGAPSQDTLNAGNANGKNWIPAECDVSIRPGWFYHKAEDDKVKTPEQLFDLYLKSVGRGANLLLNVPPDGRGLIHENDSAALVGFNRLLEANFSKKIKFDAVSFRKKGRGRFIYRKSLDDGNPNSFVRFNHDSGVVRLYMKTGVLINCIVLKEDLKKGQRISNAKIELYVWGANSESRQVKTISTIGRKRIITFPAVHVKYVTVSFMSKGKRSRLNEVEAYLMDEKLVEK
ncbi:MAG TPA: glycoside hydrolase family 29 (alpha-L-fucosidase) [Chitinophagaceae bacterium]|nr:glycoside hydrolase family 29 (alpha-L-fucosidase) [Chitinophagaceae bacterium]